MSMHERMAELTPKETALIQSRQERQKGIKRLNFWRIYFPVGLMGIVVLTIAVLFIWQALFPDQFANRFLSQSPTGQEGLIFVSAGADLIVIFLLLPVTVLCGLIPTAFLIYYLYALQRNWSVVRFIQRQLHFVEKQIAFVGRKTEESVPTIVSGVAQYRGYRMRIDTILKNIWGWIYHPNIMRKIDSGDPETEEQLG